MKVLRDNYKVNIRKQKLVNKFNAKRIVFMDSSDREQCEDQSGEEIATNFILFLEKNRTKIQENFFPELQLRTSRLQNIVALQLKTKGELIKTPENFFNYIQILLSRISEIDKLCSSKVEKESFMASITHLLNTLSNYLAGEKQVAFELQKLGFFPLFLSLLIKYSDRVDMVKAILREIGNILYEKDQGFFGYFESNNLIEIIKNLDSSFTLSLGKEIVWAVSNYLMNYGEGKSLSDQVSFSLLIFFREIWLLRSLRMFLLVTRGVW